MQYYVLYSLEGCTTVEADSREAAEEQARDYLETVSLNEALADTPVSILEVTEA